MFHIHLWVGVTVGMAILVVAVTGVALNHKRELGLMPDVVHEPTAPFVNSLPLPRLVDAAAARAGDAAAAGVDRMDVRPDDGLVKVRFRDRHVTEVTLALATGDVLHVGERNDAFLEKLHSGEIFGGGWVLLPDLAALSCLVMILSGLWLWLMPKARL